MPTNITNYYTSTAPKFSFNDYMAKYGTGGTNYGKQMLTDVSAQEGVPMDLLNSYWAQDMQQQASQNLTAKDKAYIGNDLSQPNYEYQGWYQNLANQGVNPLTGQWNQPLTPAPVSNNPNRGNATPRRENTQTQWAMPNNIKTQQNAMPRDPRQNPQQSIQQGGVSSLGSPITMPQITRPDTNVMGNYKTQAYGGAATNPMVQNVSQYYPAAQNGQQYTPAQSAMYNTTNNTPQLSQSQPNTYNPQYYTPTNNGTNPYTNSSGGFTYDALPGMYNGMNTTLTENSGGSIAKSNSLTDYLASNLTSGYPQGMSDYIQQMVNSLGSGQYNYGQQNQTNAMNTTSGLANGQTPTTALQGQVGDTISQMLNGSGLTPEYVEAMRASVLDPAQEQYVGQVNRAGGGVNSLSSGLAQELMRRNESDFNNQLIKSGYENYNNLLNLGQSSGAQNFSQGLNLAGLQNTMGQQGISNTYEAMNQGQNLQNSQLGALLGLQGNQQNYTLGMLGQQGNLLSDYLKAYLSNQTTQNQNKQNSATSQGSALGSILSALLGGTKGGASSGSSSGSNGSSGSIQIPGSIAGGIKSIWDSISGNGTPMYPSSQDWTNNPNGNTTPYDVNTNGIEPYQPYIDPNDPSIAPPGYQSNGTFQSNGAVPANYTPDQAWYNIPGISTQYPAWDSSTNDQSLTDWIGNFLSENNDGNSYNGEQNPFIPYTEGDYIPVTDFNWDAINLFG
jgi:hypothetical protein